MPTVKVLEAVIYFPDGTKTKIAGDRVAGHDPSGPAVFEVLDPNHPDRQRLYMGLPYSIVVEPFGIELPEGRGTGSRIISPGD